MIYGVEADEAWAEGSESLWTIREGLSLMKLPARDVAPHRLQVVLLSASVMAVSIVYGPDSDLASEVVESIAFGLHQVLRGNPQVQNYITRDPSEAVDLPDLVLIGGLTFTIRVDDSFTGGADLYAGVNMNTLKIRLRGIDVSAQQMQVALLHELIHAIGRVYAGAGDPSEEWVKALAQGLYQVFRDNPKLLAYVNVGAGASE